MNDNGDSPKAGEITIISDQGSIENTGNINANNWIGDNGKGGTIDIWSFNGDIKNTGSIVSDCAGLPVGDDQPAAGEVTIDTSATLFQTGEIKAESIEWNDPDGDGTVTLYYEDYSEDDPDE